MFAKKLLCIAIGSALGVMAVPSLAVASVNNRAIEIVGAGATSDPLIAVEANRSAIINRLVAEQTASLAAAGVSTEAFKNALESLRADQLLAASLVNSVEAIAAIVADAPVSGSALQRFIAISPRDAGSLDGVPAANAYLVRDGDTLSIVPAGQLQAGSQLVGYFTSAMSTTVVNVGGGASDITPKDGSGTGAGSWIGYTAGGNQASGVNSAVAAGFSNVASAFGAFVGAGTANQANGISSLVIGGFDNRANNIDTLVGAGAGNRANGARAIIVGGGYNIANGDFSFIGGGGRDGIGSTPAGTDPVRDHRAFGKWSVIGGGQGNVAGVSGSTTVRGSTVAGGSHNTASGHEAFIGGGGCNTASGLAAVVAGGGQYDDSGTCLAVNSNIASGDSSFVGGGFSNVAGGTSSVALGQGARANHSNSFVFSDGSISNSNAASSFNIQASGGVFLSPSTPRLDFGSQTRQMISLWGGPNLYGIGIQSGTQYFRVDSGSSNTSGFAWFRGGTHNDGAFNPGAGGLTVMTLSRDGQLVMPQALQQQIRIGDAANGGDVMGIGAQNYTTYTRTPVAGGFGFYRAGVHVTSEANPGTGGEVLAAVFKTGDGSFLQTATVTGTVRANAFVSTSDRAAKTSFSPINAKAILAKVAAMPVMTWVYKDEGGNAPRHIGPVSQDFVKAFRVGMDDKSIATVDADGVAFAAIQGLHQLIQEKDAKISKLERELSAIKKKLGL